MNEILGVLLLITSVLVGGGLVVILQNTNKKKIIKLLLALSGGFLISIAFIHFIPEIYHFHGDKIGYYILLGFLIQLVLEYFSGGIEHGHIHVKKISTAMPWGLFLSLSVHAFIEGIPLESQFHDNASLFDLEQTDHIGHNHGDSPSYKGLLLGIILHKIPVSIALMTLLISSGFKQSKAWLILLAFSLMAPLGLLFGHFGADKLLINLELLMAVVIGMFLHISTTIIFEASENHKLNFYKLISLLTGVALAILSI